MFIFFGLVSTLGSYYLYGHSFDFTVLLPGIAIGLLSMAVLNMNNMRDIENDAAMGKNTIVVKLGFNKARMYHFYLIVLAVIALNSFALEKGFKWYQFAFVLGFIPLLKNLKVVNTVTNPRSLDPELKRLSLTTFLISLLLSIALILM